ncbi:hypothetical protein MCNF_45490 [Mycolicibacterium confluentis]|uniref:Uncharacterized protein n=1 Tax=Mycolicibacterium confluentis TaxID=28047 RepID=A0A7I7Y3N1_9MYCO|nr:hypothetical protein MCNF_45490 [Mycolicibacterium confluentis]
MYPDIYDRLKIAFKSVLDAADGLNATVEGTIDNALGVQNLDSARSAGASSARAEVQRRASRRFREAVGREGEGETGREGREAHSEEGTWPKPADPFPDDGPPARGGGPSSSAPRLLSHRNEWHKVTGCCCCCRKVLICIG